MEVTTLDTLDRQIIHILTIEPRASFRTIADVTGISDQTAARRYRRLSEGAGLRVLGVPDGSRMGWTDWFVNALPFGILLFLLTPLLIYVLCPPSIKRSTEVTAWAAIELERLGAISRREKTMGVLAVAALVGWVAGAAFVAPVIVSLTVISAMVVTGVVSWNEIVGNRQGWHVLTWFATLVALADGLSQVGFLNWVAQGSASALVGFPAALAAVLLISLFFVIHYLFASTTAHTTAVLPAFLAAVVSIPGIPTKAVVFSLVYSLGLMGVLTPYGTGPAPLWFNAGYISATGFWKLGALTGALYLVVLLAVEVPYLLYFSR